MCLSQLLCVYFVYVVEDGRQLSPQKELTTEMGFTILDIKQRGEQRDVKVVDRFLINVCYVCRQ